jgi:hypothetical protein
MVGAVEAGFKRTAVQPVDRGALLAAAEAYTGALGWATFPIAAGTKKPLGRWRGRRYSLPELRRLFVRFGEQVGGLAVVLGKASGGLGVRDWDHERGYAGWERHHHWLGSALPVSRTGRGHHLFFKVAGERFAALADGEYRATSGHYVLLPPSRHPHGHTYEWLRAPTAPVPVVEDPVAAGLLPPPPVPPVPSYPSPFYCCGQLLTNQTADVDEEAAARAAVLASVPTAAGQRNRLLFALARALKALPRFARAPAEEALPLVRRWHELALNTPMRTRDFATSWSDFRTAWGRVRRPGSGTASLAGLSAWAFGLVSEAGVAGSRIEGDLQRLSLVCQRLQAWAGGRSFPLATRVAAGLLRCSEGTAKAAIRRLLACGELRVAAEASHAKRRATEYVYTGPVMNGEELT